MSGSSIYWPRGSTSWIFAGESALRFRSEHAPRTCTLPGERRRSQSNDFRNLWKVNWLLERQGGSMHLIDLAVRFMGSTAIVGNSIPIGVGLGLSAQLKDTEDVSCVFLGDGAIEEGVFLNL